jgi:hypothetical protein
MCEASKEALLPVCFLTLKVKVGEFGPYNQNGLEGVVKSVLEVSQNVE